jgi:PmbA protein
LQYLAWANHNVPAPIGKMPIIFTPNASTILWGTVVGALNAKYVVEKSSPWSNHLLEQVVSEKLRLWQDPTLKQCWCPFDDEGMPTQIVEFISQGVLQNFYSDLKRAKQLNIVASGNGFRASLGSYPTPDLVNLLVEGGYNNLEQIIGKLDRAILVEQILGQEPDISGDFSLNIDLGYYIEQGKIKGRIKDTMLAGNVYTALKEVIELGNDNRWIGSCYSPSLVVDSLSVIG